VIREHGVSHQCSVIKGQKTGRNHEQERCAGLSMFLGRKELATGSWMIADPLVESPAAPTTGIRRFNAYLLSERRRIVAQVRREVLKNRDFFAVQDSPRRCDDLLTTTVDNDDWAGL
jgi:hypothetical protein